MTRADSAAVLKIYAEGLATRNATFETTVPDWKQWNSNHLPTCRLVLETDGKVAGWAALSAMSQRTCYGGVAEVSVYVSSQQQGQRIGSRLLGHLVEESERNGFWTLFASVFPENEATVRLHLSHGFRKLGTRHKVAKLDARWRDTLILERRSEKVGVE